MKQVNIEYLRADKSIEEYIHNGERVFIYNNQGVYFDVFFSEDRMKAFLDDKIFRGDLFFCDEKEVNKYFAMN